MLHVRVFFQEFITKYIFLHNRPLNAPLVWHLCLNLPMSLCAPQLPLGTSGNVLFSAILHAELFSVNLRQRS